MNTDVYKIGGNVVDDAEAIRRFARELAALAGPKIVVHGGGKLLTRMADRLGIPQRMIDGRRVTDPETLRLAVMVYAGWLNKSLVAALEQAGCRAVGLSGADGALLPSELRPAGPVDYGRVGDIRAEEVNTELLRLLLEAGFTPVVCAISYGGEAGLLNSNADGVAAALASAAARMGECTLRYCFEKRGVLRTVDGREHVIPRITREDFDALRAAGIVAAGMIPKIEEAFGALDRGVRRVVIRSATGLTEESGTVIER